MTLQALASYDAQGHFIQSGERFRDYAARIERRLARLQEIEQPGNGVYGLPPDYGSVIREFADRFALEPAGVERFGSAFFADWNQYPDAADAARLLCQALYDQHLPTFRARLAERFSRELVVRYLADDAVPGVLPLALRQSALAIVGPFSAGMMGALEFLHALADSACPDAADHYTNGALLFALSGLWQYPLSRAYETARVLRAVQSERVSLAQLAEDAAAPDTFPELQKLSAEYDQERALAERFDAVLVRSSPADLRRLDRELPGGARLMADYRLFFTQARRVFERRAKDGDLQAQVILEKCY